MIQDVLERVLIAVLSVVAILAGSFLIVALFAILYGVATGQQVACS